MDEVEEIKRRIDIVDLVSSYLTLKKAGANYRAVCPFHNEKTPSFMVSGEKQIFKCFGCNEGGDVFSFLMKIDNLEFPEALKMLADRAGVKLERRKSSVSPDEKPDKKSRLFQLNNLSARVYHQLLTKHPSGKSALAYLKKRGLTNETIKIFQIGYASSNRAMKSYLLKQGFSETEIQNAGSPDRFYKRIIFPITDVMGNVLGFTGRAVEEGQEPKYLNTPETIIFHKGRILYNLQRARADIRTENSIIIVEGQMDVIGSTQAGVKNVVASSGTALTDEHLAILFRYTPNIVFAFDADSAGQLTTKKAYEMALVYGFNVKIVELGKYKDPGEMVAEDAKLWQEAVKKATPVIDWYMATVFRGKVLGDSDNTTLTSQQKKEIAKEILPIIAKIPDSIEQAHYINLLAKKLGVSEVVIENALEKITNKPQTTNYNRTTSKQEIPTSSHLTSEEILIGLMIEKPDRIEIVNKELKEDNFQKENNALYKKLINWYNSKSKEDIKKFIDNLERQESSKVKEILLEVEEKYSGSDEKIIQDLIKNIKSQNKEKLKEYYATEIKKAESNKDHEKLKKLIKEFQDAIH